MGDGSLQVRSSRRIECIPLTRQVEELIRRQGYGEGILTLFVPHTTAGITINEQADPDVARDMERWFESLIPHGFPFRHAEGNSPAHIMATLAGSSIQLIVGRGRMRLGTWQGIWFMEFDGPREREIWYRFLPDRLT